VNDRLEAPAATEPTASTAHDALVRDISARGQAVFVGVADTLTMAPDDRACAIGTLIDELDAERARLVAAREEAYRLAELECLFDSEFAKHKGDAQ